MNGIVRIGETLTLAIGIQDPSRQFDMRVLNCFASDGFKPSIQLVDEYGCVTRPKIMSPFEKTRNFGQQASVVSFATFQAFKFPDSVDVHLECGVELCKYGCPEQCYVDDERKSVLRSISFVRKQYRSNSFFFVSRARSDTEAVAGARADTLEDVAPAEGNNLRVG